LKIKGNSGSIELKNRSFLISPHSEITSNFVKELIQGFTEGGLP